MRIVESKYITSAVNMNGYPNTVWQDFAFVGRSNVGKSSMINTLASRKLLAKVANTPGKTRLINFFEVRYMLDCSLKLQSDKINDNRQNTTNDTIPTQGFFCLVDLPGYGYAKVSKSERDDWKKMINEYLKSRKQIAGVVLLVDIRHDPDPKDILMIKMLFELGINFIVVSTKCDKIPKNKIPTYKKNIMTILDLQGKEVFEFSSLKRIGINNILDWIENSILETDTKKKIVHN